MATNADDTNKGADDTKQVTADDLRDLKYNNQDGVEASKDEDETAGDDKTDDDAGEAGKDDETNSDGQATDENEENDETGSDEDSDEFVKAVPSISGDNLVDYARNLEKAYNESTGEALRLKGELEGKKPPAGDQKPDGEGQKTDDKTASPMDLYVQQKMEEEIQTAFTEFSDKYPQVTDPAEYERFKAEVAIISNAMFQSTGRLAKPGDLYKRAAAILDWEPKDKVDKEDHLKIAIKKSGSTTKTSSGTTQKAQKSKVTDQMIAVNKMMYPNKTDEEIRKELEPYVKNK
jgi:hypothetical protein